VLTRQASWVEVMGKLAAKFQSLEERCSWFEGLGKKIYNLLLCPSSGQACQADHLEEVARRLEAVLAEHC
jgi:hypothetical protein